MHFMASHWVGYKPSWKEKKKEKNDAINIHDKHWIFTA